MTNEVDQRVWLERWNVDDLPVHTAHQGSGIAALALTACLQLAADNGDREQVLAFPRTDNAASNALCRRVGFALIGEADFEYPPGHPIRVNEWIFELAIVRPSS